MYSRRTQRTMINDEPASPHALEERRRRLHFRAWRRGIREMDLILGRFADEHLHRLSGEELAAFERLLDLPDQDLYRWIRGEEPVPLVHRSGLIDRVMAFHPGKPA